MITPGIDTYELSSCYNGKRFFLLSSNLLIQPNLSATVTVSCDSKDMTAHVLTNRLFSGKLYGKGKPKSCVNDVYNSLNFNLSMPYNDPNRNCDVQQNFSRYHKDIVIQHHDLIVRIAPIWFTNDKNEQKIKLISRTRPGDHQRYRSERTLLLRSDQSHRHELDPVRGGSVSDPKKSLRIATNEPFESLSGREKTQTTSSYTRRSSTRRT